LQGVAAKRLQVLALRLRNLLRLTLLVDQSRYKTIFSQAETQAVRSFLLLEHLMLMGITLLLLGQLAGCKAQEQQ
jgi:hypothetical protein